MSAWEPIEGGRAGGLCCFRLPNLSAKPECTTDWEDVCDCGCYECDCPGCAWRPYEICYGDARVRVELEDGRVFDTCSPEAHGVGRVVWWGPIYGPRYQSPLDLAMMRMYSTERVKEMSGLGPFIPLGGERIRYEVKG